MDIEDARELAREHGQAILATHRADGGIQLSPVNVAVDAEGLVVISSTEATAKTRNLRRDPRASVCLITDRFYGAWAGLEGRASIVSLPEAMEPLVDYYRRAAKKEHPDWDDYRRAMERDRRCLIRIEPERAWGP